MQNMHISLDANTMAVDWCFYRQADPAPKNEQTLFQQLIRKGFFAPESVG
jgi:hypothetical protein